MKLRARIITNELARVRADLARPHAFAAERVGFLFAAAYKGIDEMMMLIHGYQPVDDEDYVFSPKVGAEINSEAFRKALQRAYRPRSSLIHVHAHHHAGRPRFSGVDLKSGTNFVPSFFTTVPRMPHGMIVLSNDSALGHLWVAEDEKPLVLEEFNQVGAHYRRDWKQI